VDDQRVGVTHRRPLGVARQILQPDALADHQLADVDGQALRDVAGQTLDLDLTVREVDDAALELDALGLALQRDDHGDRDRLVHLQAVEVGVQHRVLDGVEEELLDQHLRDALAGDVQPDDRVHTRARVEDARQHLRIDRDGQRAVGAAVEDRRDAAGRAEAPGFVLAAGVAGGCFEGG